MGSKFILTLTLQESKRATTSIILIWSSKLIKVKNWDFQCNCFPQKDSDLVIIEQIISVAVESSEHLQSVFQALSTNLWLGRAIDHSFTFTSGFLVINSFDTSLQKRNTSLYESLLSSNLLQYFLKKFPLYFLLRFHLFTCILFSFLFPNFFLFQENPWINAL